MKDKTAVIFGGTGFIGRQIVRELASRGIRVKVASRVPERAYFLRPCGNVGQVVPVACDYSQESISSIIKGCDFVVNCIGILFEKSKNGFQKAHVEIPKMIATAVSDNKEASFVHISALACERGTSKYAHTKLAGEQEVLQACPKAVILRPSVVFGEDDSFFNMFAEIGTLLPALPLIGGGQTKFQPVFVGDVSDAVIKALKNEDAKGHIYELAGPDTLTFKEIYQLIRQETKRKFMMVSLPMSLAKVQAFFMAFLPKPPLTPDQVESLKTDNVKNQDMQGLEELGVKPTAIELVVPEYLARYRPGGRFAYRKTA